MDLLYSLWALGNSSKTQLYKIGSKWGVYFHYLRSKLFDMHGLGSIHATKRLISKIREVEPDLIHLHNIHGYYLNYPLLFDFCQDLIFQLFGHYMTVGHILGIVYIIQMCTVTNGNKGVMIALIFKTIPLHYSMTTLEKLSAQKTKFYFSQKFNYCHCFTVVGR